MQTSVSSFLRIGEKRELKFATEAYCRKEISENNLQDIARTLRIKHWQLQQTTGIDYIASNDFSFYDQVLDTANLFNIVPKRYRDLKLGGLDTYFAQARGYQGKNGDVKALAMKKWFNTNYHYMVPEFDSATDIRYIGRKLVDELIESRENGIKTRPVIIGPFTLLKLADYKDGRKATDFITPFVTAFTALLTELGNLNVDWFQFDEPALVKDLSLDDLALFKALYQPILAARGSVKTLLQTYFGDIRDGYETITALGFDGYGLDFVEGVQTLELVQKHGFPKNAALFAGVINGKNIWRNQYSQTLELLNKLSNITTLTISTSCSLQHVPYTTENEEKLSNQVLAHFAFAKEKLTELAELKGILTNSDTEALIKNKRLFDGTRIVRNTELLKQIANLTEADFTRTPAFSERENSQKAHFNLPILPTTTIGSFPQTREVRANRATYRKGAKTREDYDKFILEEIKKCVQYQEEIGLDVLVHGEFERNDMVEFFGENLNGYVFTQFAWVQSYGTRCVKPPIIWGDVTRHQPITTFYSKYAQSLTQKHVKGMLTGPVTILNWSFPREDISLRESAQQIALAIQEEVLDLEANGIEIIQIDEAALREKLPLRKSDWFSQYLDWAIPAFRLVHSKVKPQTQIHTHMCYAEFEDIIKAIDDMDADVISFEASRSDLSILKALKANNFQTQVGPGIYDIHSPRVPSVSEMTTTIDNILAELPLEKIWINPDCGLKTRSNAEVAESLVNLIAARQAVIDNL
ncbi:5-methyltetrahydropteroyltriglutamate--homocysteine S-methyltransferase [Lactococcus hodotermopsidis]|uniref:5-methyltetrahydropteroyltriglutamate-- homocysteine S-methyltransferase n=1 Tax=Pseudolactococcus hodotermopsidis TaxID=2709157 RepID=UPI00155299F2|nr:5-methyltetrahydropteroyltriglutamate--homocysteine S-methyltransferase [Lactococcus hodotermopsidis]